MDIQARAYQYCHHIFKYPGVKAVLLDDETFQIISLAMTKTELLEHDVVSVELLRDRCNKEKDSTVGTLTAIIFVRPVQESISNIVRVINQKHYQKYAIYFSNTVSDQHLRIIAQADDKAQISDVHEVFLDYLPLNKGLFSLGIDNITDFRYNPSSESFIRERIAQGLFSVLSSLKMKPLIRYDVTSDPCKQVATSLKALVQSSNDLFNTCFDSVVVLLIDRKSDPFIPLMHLLSLAYATHDIFGIKLNTVSTDPNNRKEALVIDDRTDPENSSLMTIHCRNFPDFYGKKLNECKAIDSLDLQTLPPDQLQDIFFKKKQNQTRTLKLNKFSDVFTAITAASKRRRIVDFSYLEQALTNASEGDPNSICEEALEIIYNEGPDSSNYRIEPMDALRFVLVYILKYENKYPDNVARLQQALEKFSWSGNQLRYVQAILQYSRQSARNPELEQTQQKLFGKIMNFVKMAKQGNQNMVDFFKPMLNGLLNNFKEAKLSEKNFPFIDPNKKGTTPRIIAFYVGGATYEEYRVAYDFCQGSQNDSKFQVLVGGTTIHNAESFLEYEIHPLTD